MIEFIITIIESFVCKAEVNCCYLNWASIDRLRHSLWTLVFSQYNLTEINRTPRNKKRKLKLLMKGSYRCLKFVRRLITCEMTPLLSNILRWTAFLVNFKFREDFFWSVIPLSLFTIIYEAAWKIEKINETKFHSRHDCHIYN